MTLSPTLDDRMQTLVANGQRGQWEDTDIDWDQQIVLPRWLPKKVHLAAVSQLYHGEIVTERLCRRLLTELAEPQARNFLETQIADESRHVRVYEAYLRRLGDIAPMDPAVETAFQGGLSWPGAYHALIVASHVVLEGEALRLQQEFSHSFPCPLFRQINIMISRDEARHIAFGKVFLRAKLAAISHDERLAIYRWVKSLWSEVARATIGRYSGRSAVVMHVGKKLLNERWDRHRPVLEEIGLIASGEIPLTDRE